MQQDERLKEAMTRRQALAGSAAAAALALARPARPAEPGRRPNILFLLTDDQRWDMMGCAGNPILQTPNMDRLAREGVRFVNAFVTTSICAASRASVFCGLYERTHGYTFRTPPIRAEHAAISYPAQLKAAGYRTGFVGKYGVRAERGARAGMFDVFKSLGRNPYFKKQPDGTERHLTEIAGDHAVDFLRSCSRDEPFCLSVSFNAPHAEDSDPKQYIWPKAVDHLYRDVTIPTPPTADPAFFERQPQFLKESLNRVRWRWRFDTPEKFQRMVKGYYRMISGVDAVVGRLLAELRRLGLHENTVVVLTGDNGYFLGERGFAGKWLMYEDSIRVPLVVFDPRAPEALRGLEPEPMALNVDLAPTFLELAGVEAPELMQGRSLVPLLRGESPPWRSDFFYEHLFEHKQIPMSEGVRTERWKYIRYFRQQPVYEELYDLAEDPLETRSLVGEEGQQARLDGLRRRCDELRDRYGGPYVPRARRPAPKLEPRPAGFVEGVRGKAARFDGTTYLRAGEVPALAADEAFAWAFWVYLEARAARSGVVVGNRHLGGGDPLQFMKVTPETVQFFNTRKHSVRLAHGLPREKWVHVAVVKDAGRATCYAGGRKVASERLDFPMPALPFYLGGDPHARELASCRLDEVRLYRRALGPDEVRSLVEGSSLDEGLLAYWPLDGPDEGGRNAASR
ncbi:MAG: sulfatase-like hydrolase/transferase [Candidatus Brocadiia bacterium]